MLNSPLRYTDPTGHFEDEAIIDYLKQHYDHWWDIWTAWLQNAAWMNMLREAVAGDIFAALNNGEPIWLEFCGDGKSVLSGAVITSQPINGKSAEQVALDDYQSGALGTPVAGLLRRNRVGGGYSVKETLPYIQSQSPTGFHFELSTREVSQREATALKIGRIALIALTTGKIAAALEVKWGVGEAFAAAVAAEYGIDLLWNDYGYQAEDREVAINGRATHYANRGFAGTSTRAYTFWYRPASYSR